MQANNEQRSSQIIKNILMTWAAYAATLGIGFLMSPFLVRHLGDSVYGVWVLVGSLVGYLGLLDFGITPSIVKYIAEYRALGDQRAINRLVTTSLAIYTAIGALALALSAVLALLFNHIFATPLPSAIVAVVVLVTGLNLAITFPAAVFVGVVRGYQRYDLESKITTLTIIVRSLLLVIFIWNGYGILALVFVSFAFDMLRLAYLVRKAYNLNPAIAIRREFFDAAERRKLFGYSAYAFLMVVGKKLIFYTDAIVIAIFMPVAAVTLYSIASRLVTYLLQVSETLGVLTPTASDMGARDDQTAIKEMLVISTKYLLLLALPVACVFFVLGDIFISLWMGNAYASSAPLLMILTVAVLAHLLEMPAHTVLLGVGKHKVVALFTLAQAVANIVLSLLLVRPYGLLGVALGTTIPIVCFTAVAIVVYFRHYLRLSLADYLRRSMPLPIVLQAPFVALLLLMKVYAAPASLIVFFGEVSVALVIYAALVLLFCVSAAERRAIWRVTEPFRLKKKPDIQVAES